jgi:hypothetical protein
MTVTSVTPVGGATDDEVAHLIGSLEQHPSTRSRGPSPPSRRTAHRSPTSRASPGAA